MNTYHGTVSVESSYKQDLHYTTIQAETLDQAIEMTRSEWEKRFFKPRKILEIRLTLLGG